VSAIFTDDLTYSAFTVECPDGKYRLVIDITGFAHASEAQMMLYDIMGDADELQPAAGIH